MRCFLAAIAGLALVVFAVPTSVQANGSCLRDCPPPGWGTVRPIRHFVYYPRYWHHYSVHSATDPFAYHYSSRGYYPGAGSRYWRHHYHPERADFALPVYHQAWGYHRPAVRSRVHRSRHLPSRHLPWHY